MSLDKMVELLSLVIDKMGKAGISATDATVTHFKGHGNFNYVRVSGKADGVITTIDICLD